MAGTPAGGRKAVATVKKTRPDFYKEIGKSGGLTRGKNVKNRGFASMDEDEHLRIAAIGGERSKRAKKRRLVSPESTRPSG